MGAAGLSALLFSVALNKVDWLLSLSLSLSLSLLSLSLSLSLSLPSLTIGHMQDPVTWYGINYTGTQMTQWDFQNKGKSRWTGKSSFVLEVPLRHLRPSVIYSVPCDWILQMAYCHEWASVQPRSQGLARERPRERGWASVLLFLILAASTEGFSRSVVFPLSTISKFQFDPETEDD